VAQRRPSATPSGGVDRGFAALYLGSFLAYGDRYLIVPILVLIAADFHVSLGAASAVATLYLLLYGALQFFYGLATDRFGRVKIMRMALVGIAVADTVAAIAPNLGSLVVVRGIAAAFSAGIVPTSFVYVGDNVPFERRQRVIANVLAAGSLGTVVAIVGAGLLGRYATWRLVFLLPAVLAAVDVVLLVRLPESHAGHDHAGIRRQLRKVLSRRWAVFLIVLALFEGAAMLTFITFLAPALQVQGVSSAVAGLVVAAYGVAAFFALQALKAMLARGRVSSVFTIAVGGATLVAAYVLAGASQTVAIILVASVLIGVGYSFMHSSLQTWATEVVPEARGTAVSLFVTAVYSGSSLAHVAVAPLASTHRFGMLFVSGACIAAPVVVVAGVARSRFRSGGAQRPSGSLQAPGSD